MSRKKLIPGLLLALSLLVLLAGCGGGGGNNNGPGVITGYVYCSGVSVQILSSPTHPSDYEPASGASVTVDAPAASTTTGADGYFAFGVVNTGTRTLTVTLAGGGPAHVFTCTVTSGTTSPTAFLPGGSQSGLVVRSIPNNIPTSLGDLAGKSVYSSYTVMNAARGQLTIPIW